YVRNSPPFQLQLQSGLGCGFPRDIPTWIDNALTGRHPDGDEPLPTCTVITEAMDIWYTPQHIKDTMRVGWMSGQLQSHHRTQLELSSLEISLLPTCTYGRTPHAAS